MQFFLPQTSTLHSFTFNSQFLYELKHKVHLSKTECGIFHFRFRLVFIAQQKVWTLKRHNFFQNKNNTTATYSFAPT